MSSQLDKDEYLRGSEETIQMRGPLKSTSTRCSVFVESEKNITYDGKEYTKLQGHVVIANGDLSYGIYQKSLEVFVFYNCEILKGKQVKEHQHPVYRLNDKKKEAKRLIKDIVQKDIAKREEGMAAKTNVVVVRHVIENTCCSKLREQLANKNLICRDGLVELGESFLNLCPFCGHKITRGAPHE